MFFIYTPLSIILQNLNFSYSSLIKKVSMRLLLLVSVLLSATPVLANPFVDKPKEAQPDYDQVPNEVPIGLTLQVLDADTLSALGVQGQSVGLAVTEVFGLARQHKSLDFQTGDVITHLNSEPVKGMGHYKEVVDRAKPNSEVTIRLFRNGVNKDVKLFRVHAFGFQLKYNRMHNRFHVQWSTFNSDLRGCTIQTYNNKKPNQVEMKEVYLAKFGVFMVKCSDKTPRFVKVDKKRYYGYWSVMMYDFKYRGPDTKGML